MSEAIDYLSLEKDLDQDALVKARRSLLAFTLFTNPYYRVNWHHKQLAKKLTQFANGEIRFLMVFMPPRHGKSELVSRRLPAFLHGLYPDCEIMAASYLDTLASDMCIAVQNIIESSEYRSVFPETRIYPQGTNYSKGTRNSSEHHIVGRRGKYRGQGVGGSFTGKGANFIIIDDPIKGREVADSIAFRERLWNFYNNDLFSRLETDLQDGRLGQVLITQTRWHEDDLSGRLIEQMESEKKAVQWDVVNYPAIKMSDDDDSDPREIGEPLWPEKYDNTELDQIRISIGQRAWSSVYQQNPTPLGGALFKDEMFEFDNIPEKFDWAFITADTAYNERKENDFTAFSYWRVKGEQLYLADIFYKQIQAADVEKAVEPFVRSKIQYSFRVTLIEPKGHGIYLNQLWAKKGLMIPSESALKEFFSDRKMDKVERANNVVPHLANRKVVINKNLANKEELMAQCLGFPKTKHDDFVDTLIDALKKVYGSAPSILDVLD